MSIEDPRYLLISNLFTNDSIVSEHKSVRISFNLDMVGVGGSNPLASTSFFQLFILRIQ